MVPAKRKPALKAVAARSRVAVEHDDIRQAIERAARRRAGVPPTFEEDVHAIWLMQKGVAREEWSALANAEKEKKRLRRIEAVRSLYIDFRTLHPRARSDDVDHHIITELKKRGITISPYTLQNNDLKTLRAQGKIPPRHRIPFK